MAKADEGTDYIKVTLARPVPENGQGRVVIVKTYKDAKSYYVDGKTIVFNRPLGIRRNKVVLPAGYEVVGLTVPSQIRTEKDGRIAISFMHAGTGEAPLVLKAVKDAQTGAAAMPKELTKEKSWESPFAGEIGAGAAVGAGLSGSRYCLFFAAAGDACVQPVSRLHGDAAGDQWICECGADGKRGE